MNRRILLALAVVTVATLAIASSAPAFEFLHRGLL